ncbi:SUMF1/EgtB/PvdO family nonheme iron enzyme [Paraburkholderia flagellata]|uniref:SUMF1/EgtB/PvdO family nonheme iron enzyme n=1 Tax=Paraburkholderia flagellata TaxID=2883241 RepID=UPI001F26BBF1|nr:SUMF1/EgtB/PvdO family nonheme iron enzyme [Paraburkholderia flagellata]
MLLNSSSLPMADEKPSLWLSEGWEWVKTNKIDAPLHWRKDSTQQWVYEFGLDGLLPIDPDAPVRHISYYEADAYARWAVVRPPTECEWESAAEGVDPAKGNFRISQGL